MLLSKSKAFKCSENTYDRGTMTRNRSFSLFFSIGCTNNFAMVWIVFRLSVKLFFQRVTSQGTHGILHSKWTRPGKARGEKFTSFLATQKSLDLSDTKKCFGAVPIVIG